MHNVQCINTDGQPAALFQCEAIISVNENSCLSLTLQRYVVFFLNEYLNKSLKCS